MLRLCVPFIGLLGLATWHAPARASGDYGCGPSWKLDQAAGCDNLIFLAPGNDTRVNLTLLLLDKAGRQAPPAQAEPGGYDPYLPEPLFDWSGFRARFKTAAEPAPNSSFADGEGSRCRSNATGAASFEAAVAAARDLPDGERAALIAARRDLKPNCAGPSPGAATRLAGINSRTARDFARYLEGARAFYDGSFDEAATAFAALAKADDAWLREAARYMLARVEVNRAQLDAFDEYGTPRKPGELDSKALAAAESELRHYLRDHRAGRYARSARGLLRRVHWLAGDLGKLAPAYAAAFAQSDDERGLGPAALAEEIDHKLLPQLAPYQTSDPLLLATLDLQRMRVKAGEDSAVIPEILTRSELEAQRRHFSGHQPLFDHLLATHAFFVARTPAEVLSLIPDAARQRSFTALQFSRQMLRGMALDATRDRNARGFWLELLPGATAPNQRATVELALALHEERNGGLSRLFAAGSPVRTSAIRQVLLANVAGADLLRQQAQDAAAPRRERELALFTLLFKELSRGRYREFLADVALVPASASVEPASGELGLNQDIPAAVFVRGGTGDHGCPTLKASVARLVGNAADPTARLCVAEFLRVNGFDGIEAIRPPADELGGTASLFPGQPFSRLELYKSIIADPKAAAPDQAYALYRAVRCYAPARMNGCGGEDVPVDQRRAWFLQLKKDHPASRWAKALRFYW
ncbi:MAG TPA: hypothetical protein VF631_05405 [Allosphingosinicella sp.]|uniref:hypothetical protein n=1 Tax=Allosphingosinicella sp. TaxID=2823234 RepID=UPI002F299F6C